MKTASKANANTPSQLEIDAVKALRTGSELTEAALEALEGLSRAPKRLAALNALLDESEKPAASESKPAPLPEARSPSSRSRRDRDGGPEVFRAPRQAAISEFTRGGSWHARRDVGHHQWGRPRRKSLTRRRTDAR